MKICPVGAELFHADRRTYMTKLIVAIRSSTNASKKTVVSNDAVSKAADIIQWSHLLAVTFMTK